MPGGQQHPHVGARSDAVGDQFRRGQSDVTMIVEDQ
jgi:hypothetical protein